MALFHSHALCYLRAGGGKPWLQLIALVLLDNRNYTLPLWFRVKNRLYRFQLKVRTVAPP